MQRGEHDIWQLDLQHSRRRRKESDMEEPDMEEYRRRRAHAERTQSAPPTLHRAPSGAWLWVTPPHGVPAAPIPGGLTMCRGR